MNGTTFRRYGIAVIAVVVAVAVRLLLDPIVGNRWPVIFISGAVVFVAWYAGRRPALLALVLGCAAAVFLIIEPRYSFRIAEATDIFAVFGYVVVGGATIALFDQLQRVSALRRESAAELADFFENATIGLHWIGSDGTILRANNAELQKIAVEYGLRVTDPRLFSAAVKASSLAVQERIVQVIDPPAYELMSEMIDVLTKEMAK